MDTAEVVSMFKSRARRRFRHGVGARYSKLTKKLQHSAKAAGTGEKPKAIKTHLRDAIIRDYRYYLQLYFCEHLVYSKVINVLTTEKTSVFIDAKWGEDGRNELALDRISRITGAGSGCGRSD